MAEKRLLMDSQRLSFTLSRLCQQLIEEHGDFSESVIIGLQPRGIHVATRIHQELEKLIGKTIEFGYLDTTFHRDDFRRREAPIQPSQTNIPFLIEQKKVVLIDDVLYTGRSVRAALNAMNAFGRPSKVELLVLIDRLYCREVPIEASYIGKKVNTLQSQKVLATLNNEDKNDQIWLVNKEK